MMIASLITARTWFERSVLLFLSVSFTAYIVWCYVRSGKAAAPPTAPIKISVALSTIGAMIVIFFSGGIELNYVVPALLISGLILYLYNVAREGVI
jgi:hypothetical protein